IIGVPFSILSHSLVVIIDTIKVVFLLFMLTHDLNKSHIHHSTCSSMLRSPPKSEGFLEIFDLLSCISNKLFNSWHVESCT
ncbi:hypothetical protein EJD97_010690, partial [Solanum chilense]